MESSLDQRIRKNLEGIRDEFRLLYLKHPPLYHQRFSSPMEMTRAGWQAFSKQHFRGEGDYVTYVATDNEFLGLLSINESYGEVLRSKDEVGRPRLHVSRHPGYRDFLRLCHRIGMLLFRIPISSMAARSEWMDIVHDLAELQASPILRGDVSVWDVNFLPVMVTDRGGNSLDDDCDLNAEDERSEGNAKFPKYPLVSSLDRDVFRSSAAAIDLLLDPELYFVWRRYRPEAMPFDLTDVTARHTAIVPVSAKQTVPLPVVETKPDFLFAKSGNVWHLRFRTGDGFEEGDFTDTTGLNYYYSLLQSGGNGVTALELSPTGMDADEMRPTSSVEYDDLEWQDDESEFSGATVEGSSFQRTKGDEWRIQRKALESIEAEIAALEESGENKALLKELKSDRRQKKRELKTGLAHDPTFAPAYRAFNRVKISLRRARMAIAGESGVKGGGNQRPMPKLALFLEVSFQRKQFGWRYTPPQPVEWTFSMPD